MLDRINGPSQASFQPSLSESDTLRTAPENQLDSLESPTSNSSCFSKIWSAIVQFFRWLFCCSSSIETAPANHSHFKIQVSSEEERQKVLRHLENIFDEAEAASLQRKQDSEAASQTLNKTPSSTQEIFEVPLNKTSTESELPIEVNSKIDILPALASSVETTLVPLPSDSVASSVQPSEKLPTFEFTSIDSAADQGDIDKVKELIPLVAPSEKVEVLSKALVAACGAANSRQHAEIALLLLDNGADANFVDETVTPLTALCGRWTPGSRSDAPKVTILNALFKHHADPNIATEYGFTPLEMTFNCEAVQLLLANGADPDQFKGATHPQTRVEQELAARQKNESRQGEVPNLQKLLGIYQEHAKNGKISPPTKL